MWLLLALLFALTALGSLGLGLFLLVFRRGWRRRGLLIGAFGSSFGIIAMFQAIEADARSQGWQNAADKTRAAQMGIDTPADFAPILQAEQDQAAAQREAAKTDADRLNDQMLAALEFAAGKRKPAEPSGAHCLSPLDGSSPELITAVLDLLKDPDSFEHIETLILPADAAGQNSITMTYRAKNSFGGMVIETAKGSIENATCAARLNPPE